MEGPAFEEEELAFDETEDEDVFFAELLDFAEEVMALDELLDFLMLLLLLDLADEVTLDDEDEEVFLAELDDEDVLDELLLVEELFLLEEVVFALVLLEDEDLEKVADVAKNSGRTMRAPPTRVVGATRREPAGARSTSSASTA